MSKITLFINLKGRGCGCIGVQGGWVGGGGWGEQLICRPAMSILSWMDGYHPKCFKSVKIKLAAK